MNLQETGFSYIGVCYDPDRGQEYELYINDESEELVRVYDDGTEMSGTDIDRDFYEIMISFG